MVPYELMEGLRWERMILEVSLVLLSRTCIMVAIEWKSTYRMDGSGFDDQMSDRRIIL